MPTLDEILALITTPAGPAGDDSHSPTYEFLWGSYETLAPHLDPPRRPNWSTVAQKLAAKGVLDGEGKPPTGERVRKAWWKVTRDRRRLATGTISRRHGRIPAAGLPTSAPAPESIPLIAPPTPGTQPQRRASAPESPPDDDLSDFRTPLTRTW
jgi:hypothetical protein